VKLTLFAPEATVTELGTATALLLLARFTTIPPLGAAPLSPTVQLSAPAALIEDFAQFRLDRAGVVFDPLPCSVTQPDTRAALVVVPATWS
jgi:hypothetical protein